MLSRIESTMWGRRLDYDYLEWIARKAEKFGVTGTTFFRDDGSIEVIAEGEESALEKFTKRLSRGHLFIQVENFSVVWSKPSGKYEDFSIFEKESSF